MLSIFRIIRRGVGQIVAAFIVSDLFLEYLKGEESPGFEGQGAR
jgi:hypothetical protein